ncbi:unnamed protein product [Nesidiocoris tenuis]|uniref:Uncharacterized protein n=2 Tax=Nesidiocoris tenuis TaxID=355587 RepID=A0A6H5G930_9HEMI|nr:S_TK_X [Nesidiocoris tenuis]CAA9999388.1 unnamed protein product [Nesidiocoris tenuis]
MRDRYGALSFTVNDWKEFLVQSKQSFKKRYYAKSPSDVSRDDFDILRTLGSGSFGRVLLARRKSDNHYFAIKVLDKAKVVKTKQVEHTLNEKQILQAVRCPFTVHLEQFFQDNLYLFFVLPLVVGGEMFTHLRKLGKFHESVTRFYAAQVILGLEYLHFLDLIYRDLKPENLLIDHIGYLKITDFGFCKILKKRTYTVCGTPEYLAPEIILRKGYGHSVDWWTLGVLIFEMAAGYPPFTAKDTMKLYEKIIACKYAFPSNFTSDVKDIIRNILQVDTSKRFGNLKGGADDIKHHKFFKSIQWLPLANKKLVSPFIPHVSGPSDVSNFQRCSEEPLQVSSQNKYAAEFADF